MSRIMRGHSEREYEAHKARERELLQTIVLNAPALESDIETLINIWNWR